VLDLRGNGGGTLKEAVSVVASFLEADCVLTSVMRDASRVYQTKGKVLAPDRPLVVLVNGGSASASEVAAGALQDYRRALVLGEHTLGKGVIQTVYSLGSRESGVKLTTARYLTPAGRSLQKKRREPRSAMERGGIIPDVVMAITDREWRDVIEVRDRWSMPAAVVTAMQGHPAVFRSIPEDFRDRQLDGAIVYLATGRRPRTELK
jgi:carboxyl-terminal processing protease